MITKFIKSMTDMFGGISNKNWCMKNDDVMAYFEAEYKKEAKHAYEYWCSNGKLNYSN